MNLFYCFSNHDFFKICKQFCFYITNFLWFLKCFLNSQTFYDVSIYFLSSRNFFDFFFWKSQSNLKKEKQKKNEKGKKQKKNRGVITGRPITACYIYCKKGEKKGMQAALALATALASGECYIIVLTVL